MKNALVLFVIFFSLSVFSQKRSVKTERYANYVHIFNESYADTLYTFLDADGNTMSYKPFWVKLAAEGWTLKTITEKGKPTIKQLSPSKFTKTIGIKIELDSLDYSYSKKTAADFKSKHVVLIYFFTGCGACPFLYKDIKLFEKEFPEITFAFITFKNKHLPEYLKKHDIPEVLIVPENQYTKENAACFYSGPSTLFLDKTSRIRYYQSGFLKGPDLRQLFISKLEKLQKE